MNETPEIDILLATYNGERYLEAQLQSLLQQDHSDWRLLVRDDNSSDRTPAILHDYAAAHPGRIEILNDGKGNLGVKANFSALMQAGTADYAMFCDQDDVWLPSKIGASYAAMKALERRCGRDRPLLVHCDLHLVDGALRDLHPSYRRYQNINPETSRKLNRALLQNVALGCSAMINRSLRTLAAPVPPDARGHDWWTSLIAAALGEIEHLPDAHILYRQHGDNDVGATQWTLPALLRNLTSQGLAFCRAKQEILRSSQRQAAALLALHGGQMSQVNRTLVSRYASLLERNPMERRLDIFRFGFFFDGYIKNAGMFLLV